MPGLGTRGAWRRLAVASAGADLTLEATGLPGVISLLVAHCNGRPGYSLHGPLMWPPRQTERILHPRLRRTIRAKSHAPMMFALGPGGAKQPWPRCGQKRGDMWECLGVPLEEPVVLIAPAEAEVGWAIAFAQSVTNQEVHMTRAKWGRLLHVVNADLAGAADAIVTPWREAGRMGEPDRLRIRLKPDDSVDVHPLAAGTWWIAGTEARPSQDRFLEVSSPTTSAHRVPVLDLLSHPFEQTYTVALELGAVLQGLTLAADGTAAGGALVTLFEPLPTDDPPPYRRHVPQANALDRGDHLRRTWTLRVLRPESTTLFLACRAPSTWTCRQDTPRTCAGHTPSGADNQGRRPRLDQRDPRNGYLGSRRPQPRRLIRGHRSLLAPSSPHNDGSRGTLLVGTSPSGQGRARRWRRLRSHVSAAPRVSPNPPLCHGPRRHHLATASRGIRSARGTRMRSPGGWPCWDVWSVAPQGDVRRESSRSSL